jgi:hypothetical protein
LSDDQFPVYGFRGLIQQSSQLAVYGRVKELSTGGGRSNPAQSQASKLESSSRKPFEVLMDRQRACCLKWIVPLVAVALLSVAAVRPAQASLGGDVGSIQADQVKLQGTRQTTAKAAYTVHEIQSASGTVVREYLSADGKVFAVTFRGPFLPDIRQILGDYFEQYSAARQAQVAQNPNMRRARRPVVVDEPGLNVQIGGHPRAFAGRAYVPGMLPAGVQLEEIQ